MISIPSEITHYTCFGCGVIIDRKVWIAHYQDCAPAQEYISEGRRQVREDFNEWKKHKDKMNSTDLAKT